MSFDPRAEPCSLCGREQDECICPPDFPGDPIQGLDDDFFDWDFYEEISNEDDREETNGEAGNDTSSE